MPNIEEQDIIQSENYENDVDNLEEDINENNNDTNEMEIGNNLELRRTSRVRQPSSRLRDYITSYTVRYPIQNFLSYDKISPSYQAFLTIIEKEIEPKNLPRGHSKSNLGQSYERRAKSSRNKIKFG
jgi:hypothetical protein